MKRNKNTLVRLGAIFVALIFATGFISCASTSVESTKESEKFPKLEQGKSPYYDQFVEKFQVNPDDESIGEILKNWNASSPDGDYYKSCFSFFYNGAVEPGDYTGLSFPDNIAYVEYPENNDILIYRDCLLSKKGMEMAISFLEEGVKKYPNRIDLWDVLISIYSQYNFYEDLKDSLLEFIDISYKVDDTLNVWYVDFNTESPLPKFKEPDSIVRKIILINASSIIDSYPEENSMKYYEEIFTKLAELYPNDPYVWNELGFSCLFSDYNKGLECCKKAYYLDNNFQNAVSNIVLFASLLRDRETAFYFAKIAYEFNDKNINLMVNENLKLLDREN